MPVFYFRDANCGGSYPLIGAADFEAAWDFLSANRSQTEGNFRKNEEGKTVWTAKYDFWLLWRSGVVVNTVHIVDNNGNIGPENGLGLYNPKHTENLRATAPDPDYGPARVVGAVSHGKAYFSD